VSRVENDEKKSYVLGRIFIFCYMIFVVLTGSSLIISVLAEGWENSTVMLKMRKQNKDELKELEKVQNDAKTPLEEIKQLKELLQDATDAELDEMAAEHDGVADTVENDIRRANALQDTDRSRSSRRLSFWTSVEDPLAKRMDERSEKKKLGFLSRRKPKTRATPTISSSRSYDFSLREETPKPMKGKLRTIAPPPDDKTSMAVTSSLYNVGIDCQSATLSLSPVASERKSCRFVDDDVLASGPSSEEVADSLVANAAAPGEADPFESPISESSIMKVKGMLPKGMQRQASETMKVVGSGMRQLDSVTKTAVIKFDTTMKPMTDIIGVGIETSAGVVGIGADLISDSTSTLADPGKRVFKKAASLSSRVFSEAMRSDDLENSTTYVQELHQSENLMMDAVREGNRISPTQRDSGGGAPYPGAGRRPSSSCRK